ncbi:hypothetical protein [Streptomyces sp. NBC_00470]|uniref:hypothetical protein n=1 Tax=Streptomyces sp. NBC_00470 TaxID=2975753 RepID=UPI0030E25F55
MPALFPHEIREFDEVADQRDYIRGEHLNEVQDEIVGLTDTLGLNPHVYETNDGQTVTYRSMAHRMDNMQWTQERMAYNQDGLLEAGEKGWNLPTLSMRSTGQSIAPMVDQKDHDPADDWHRVRWNRRVIDSDNMLPSARTQLICPKTGWWVISGRFMMWRTYGPENLDHRLFCEMRLSGTGATGFYPSHTATDSASLNRHSPGYLRVNPTYSGPWYKGERLWWSLQHSDNLRVSNRPAAPYPLGTVAISGWAGCTYIRALPEDHLSRPPWDQMPVDPE